MQYFGDFQTGSLVFLMFNTFTSNDPSESSTITNFVNTDVHIHKDDGLTQRNNAAGITVSVDFDGVTGSHFIKIDSADNTVANFFKGGHDYFVRIEGTTVDGGTINAVVGQFSLDNRMAAGKLVSTHIATLASQTSFTLDVGSADNDAYNGAVAIISDLASGIQRAHALILDYVGGSKTITLDADPGIFTMAQDDNITILIPAGDVLRPTVAGRKLKVTAAGAADSLLQGFLATLITETTAARIAASFSTLFDNGDAASALTLDDIKTSNILHSGSTRAGSTTTAIELAASAPTTTIIGNALLITAGVLKGRGGIIVAYDGTTKIATIKTALPSVPANNTAYEVGFALSFSEITRPGYTDDSVWVDTVNGATGTTPNFHGTQDKKTKTEEEARTLADNPAVNAKRFMITPNSNFIFTQAYNSYEFLGGALVDTAGFDLSNCRFFTMGIAGNHLAASGIALFFDCLFLGNTIAAAPAGPGTPGFAAIDTTFIGDMTLGNAGSYRFVTCTAVKNDGSAVSIDWNAANNASVVLFQLVGGLLTMKNMGVGSGSYILNLFGEGKVTLDATCVGGTVNVAGNIDFDSSASSGMTINDNSQYALDKHLIDSIAFKGADVGTILASVVSTTILKNAAFSNFTFEMVDADDLPLTGLSVTGSRRLDNGAVEGLDGTITEVSNGLYEIDALAADTNGDFVTWLFTSPGAKNTKVSFITR